MVDNRHDRPFLRASALALSLCSVSLPVLAQDKQSVGVTLAARGEVAAIDLVDLTERSLRRRSDVFNVDRVTTGAGARAQIRMEDDALLSLRENSELVIAEYEYNEDTGEGRAIMELVSGGLRTLSGRISPDSGESDYELRTSAGSIGIRGTHYEVVIRGPDTVMGVWNGNIDVTPPRGEPFSLGQEGDFSFAEIGQTGEVEFLLEPPEVFSEGYGDEIVPEDATGPEEDDSASTGEGDDETSEEAPEDGEPEEESDDGAESSDDEGQGDETEGSTSEESSDDESGNGSVAADDSAENNDDDPGSADAGVPSDNDVVGDSSGAGDSDNQSESSQESVLPALDEPEIGNTLRAELERPAPGSLSSVSSDNEPLRDGLNERAEEDVPIATQPVDFVPTAPTAVASRTGTVTYSEPDFTLDSDMTGYSMRLRFDVDFAAGTVDNGYLELSDNSDVWKGWFAGGVGSVNADGDIGLQLGDTIGRNPLSMAVHNDNPAEGYLNGIFYGASGEQVRGNFGFTDVVTEQSINGDYRVGEQ